MNLTEPARIVFDLSAPLDVDAPTHFGLAREWHERGVRDGVFSADPPAGSVIFARERGTTEPVGMATFYTFGETNIWLQYLWVEPHSRREGAATALIDAVADYAAAHGAERMELGVFDSNKPMLLLLERTQFAKYVSVFAGPTRPSGKGAAS